MLAVVKYGATVFLWRLPEKLRLVTLDVGQGDAVLLEIPKSNVQILFDGGPDSGIIDKLMSVLPPGDRTIDVIVLTHPHDDHLQGILDLLDVYRAGLIIETGATSDSPAGIVFKERIQELDIPVLKAIRGQKIFFGGSSSITVLHPFLAHDAEFDNINDSSIVALVEHRGQHIFLTGDLETTGEKEMFAYIQSHGLEDAMQSSVIKIAHHGSRTGTSDKLLEMVDPKKAIVSSGKDNKFGHPHEETLKKLKERGIEIRRTDKEGDIIMEID